MSLSERLTIAIVPQIAILFVALVKFGLDVAIILQINTSGIIAFQDLTSPVNYQAIASAIFIFSSLSLLATIFLTALIFSTLESVSFVGLVGELILVSIEITREALFANFIVCFNTSNVAIIYSRYAMAFLLAILFLGLAVSFLVDESRNKSESSSSGSTVVKTMRFLVVLALVVATIILNIYAGVNMKPALKNDINPKRIKLGFYSSNEIKKFDNQENLQRDSLYDVRTIGTLNDLIYSPLKTLIYERCYYDSSYNNQKSQLTSASYSCDRYYKRTLYVEIDCSNSRNEAFFKDCVNTTKLAIKTIYNELGGYPIYNCAKKTLGKCVNECPELANNDYQLIFVQSNDDIVEPAWKGFCNCGKKQPRYDLTEDPEVYACKAKANFLQASFIVLITFVFFCL